MDNSRVIAACFYPCKRLWVRDFVSPFGREGLAISLVALYFAHPCAPPFRGRLWDVQQDLLEQITTASAGLRSRWATWMWWIKSIPDVFVRSMKATRIPGTLRFAMKLVSALWVDHISRNNGITIVQFWHITSCLSHTSYACPNIPVTTT